MCWQPAGVGRGVGAWTAGAQGVRASGGSQGCPLPFPPAPVLTCSAPALPPGLALQMKLSRCGQRVAFTLEGGTGEESWAAFTRDLRTGATRHLGSLGTVVSLEWAADGRTLLCTQPNEMGRPWRVLACDAAAAAGAGGRRRGGSGGDRGSSRVVFEEGDERFFVELGRTKDWRCASCWWLGKATFGPHLPCQGFLLMPGAGPGEVTEAASLLPRLTPPPQPPHHQLQLQDLL